MNLPLHRFRRLRMLDINNKNYAGRKHKELNWTEKSISLNFNGRKEFVFITKVGY